MIILSASSLSKSVLAVLKQVEVLPRRLVLSTQSNQAEVPRLRGVWGRALHELDRKAYDEVFHPDNSNLPRYILRPVQPSPQHSPQFEFILLGGGARYDEISLRAWDVASGMGLGEARAPFVVLRRAKVNPLGSEVSGYSPWPLSNAVWPLSGDPETTACQIQYLTPVALNRNGKLIEQPTLKDILAKGCRRLGGLLPETTREHWDSVGGGLIDWARTASATYAYGEPVGLARYSGSQRQDFAIPCVSGAIGLPDGPGPSWPLLAALQWIHIGKSTNVGLGQLSVSAMMDQ